MGLINKLLKAKEKPLEVEVVEPIDERKQELATVQVRDIKEYLLEEYERSQGLFKSNEYLRGELKKAEEIKMKYDATLVTLDEYKTRLESYEKKLIQHEKEYQQAREETKTVREELNNYKIKFQRASITKEEIKAEIIEETKQDIIKRVMEHKGHLSKQIVVDIIRKEQIWKNV